MNKDTGRRVGRKERKNRQQQGVRKKRKGYGKCYKKLTAKSERPT